MPTSFQQSHNCPNMAKSNPTLSPTLPRHRIRTSTPVFLLLLSATERSNFSNLPQRQDEGTKKDVNIPQRNQERMRAEWASYKPQNKSVLLWRRVSARLAKIKNFLSGHNHPPEEGRPGGKNHQDARGLSPEAGGKSQKDRINEDSIRLLFVSFECDSLSAEVE